jgi:hypothetical protein
LSELQAAVSALVRILHMQRPRPLMLPVFPFAASKIRPFYASLGFPSIDAVGLYRGAFLRHWLGPMPLPYMAEGREVRSTYVWRDAARTGGTLPGMIAGMPGS